MIGTGTAALIGAGGSLAGGLISGLGAKSAADQTAAASRYAADLQNQQYQQSRTDLAPWRTQGTTAINALGQGMTGTQDQRNAFAEMFKTDPGYQFRMDQGVKALDHSAASRGLLQSGAQEKAISDYGQNTGTQAYGDWYNRLANLAGVGQNAANTTTQAGTTAAGNAGQAITSGANTAGQLLTSGYNSAASGVGAGINNALFYNYLGNRAASGGPTNIVPGNPGGTGGLFPYGT